MYASDLQAHRDGQKNDGADQEEEFSFAHFAHKARSFVLAQTKGPNLPAEE